MTREVLGRRPRPRSTVDTVVETIKDLLKERKLRAGDLMPSESELARILGASRSSIREAMKILSALGVVDIRQGDGTYVGSGGRPKMLDPALFELLVSEPELDELVELRVLVETGIATLIVRHGDDAALAELEEAHRAMVEAARAKDSKRVLDADVQFHHALGHACGNRLVQAVYEFVIELFAPTMRPGAWVDVHSRLLTALRRKDLQAAIWAVEEHADIWRSLNQPRRGARAAKASAAERGSRAGSSTAGQGESRRV